MPNEPALLHIPDIPVARFNMRLQKLGFQCEAHRLKVPPQSALPDLLEGFRLLLGMDGRAYCLMQFWLGDLWNALVAQHGDVKAEIVKHFGEGMYHRMKKAGAVARAYPVARRLYLDQNGDEVNLLERVPWHVFDEFKYSTRETQDAWLHRALSGKRITRERARQVNKIDRSQQKADFGAGERLVSLPARAAFEPEAEAQLDALDPLPVLVQPDGSQVLAEKRGGTTVLLTPLAALQAKALAAALSEKDERDALLRLLDAAYRLHLTGKLDTLLS